MVLSSHVAAAQYGDAFEKKSIYPLVFVLHMRVCVVAKAFFARATGTEMYVCATRYRDTFNMTRDHAYRRQKKHRRHATYTGTI